MPSTFFGLTIAGSGLNAFQAAVNTTANNIANVQTKGYSRQVANRVQSESLRVYARYGTTGSGVTTTSITQIRDSYYDVKYWENNASLGLYEKKLYYMQQIEDYFIDDNSTKGFTTILNAMFNNLDYLSDAPGDMDRRKTFISSCQNLANYFNSVSIGLERIQTDANLEVLSTVNNINAIAEKIALLNNQINIVEMQGGYANELRDQRALLIDELSGIVPTEVKETQVLNTNDEYYVGCTEYVVKINGQTLVNTREYRTLECQTREYKINQSDIDGIYDIKWSDTGNDFSVNSEYMAGSLKALIDIRDGNNEENFKGTLDAVSGKKLVIKNPSQSTVEEMTIPEEGVITIQSKKFEYTSFEVEFDADGNATYTFELKEEPGAGAAALCGYEASVGTSINCMGVPYYFAQMNQFLRAFAAKFNDIEMDGETLSEVQKKMGAFFVARDKVSGEQGELQKSDTYNKITSSMSSYYKMTAANFEVSDASVKDASIFATTTQVVQGVDKAELIDLLLPLKEDVKLYRGSGSSGFLQCMLADVTVDAQEAKLFYDNHHNISLTITNQRLSISGVDEDEEALDLVKFQNAYNLASKMISTMAEMYDQLILNTAV
ncbi:MAG: flagellar hook-associated protein FlgK [Lachnospiraceae bacterium]|nr:flagellar hook-associated protein FlgK [Lachnospiraceae bacterium]